MLVRLPVDARKRFERLHARCVEMRTIAAGVRGASHGPGVGRRGDAHAGPRSAALAVPAAAGLEDRARSLSADDERAGDHDAPRRTCARASRRRRPEATSASSARCRTASRWRELRLDNFGRAKKNAEFVSIELDRIEGKIQALAEMAVNRQDPDFLSSQVDSAAESMRQTEKAVSELQHLTGLADQLEEPPPILETDLRGALRDHA